MCEHMHAPAVHRGRWRLPAGGAHATCTDSRHRQIITRTVKAKYHYNIVPATELNSTDLFLIDGVANDRYLQGETEEKGTWVQPYELDDSSDNPRDNPRNWQHVIAVKGGKLCRTYTNVSMKWLHLLNGKPDPEKGFFIRIDKVYKLTRKGGI